MNEAEEIIWSEKAGMKDFTVYPVHWVFTIGTLGLYFLIIYLLRFYTRYTLTNERLIIESGILKKERDEIELFRVKDSSVRAGLFQRFVGYGNIAVVSTDLTGDFVLENIPDAISKREQIRDFAKKAREAAGVRTIVNE